MRHFARIVAPFLTGCALVGCGGSDRMGTTDMHADSVCATDTRAQTYVQGLSSPAVDSSGISIKLLDAMPAPPARYLNNWVVELLDANGQPVDGATLVATPFMPDHGHGASTKPTIKALGNGQYEIDQLNLFMPGLWRTTIEIAMPTPPTGSHSVQFLFCVDG